MRLTRCCRSLGTPSRLFTQTECAEPLSRDQQRPAGPPARRRVPSSTHLRPGPRAPRGPCGWQCGLWKGQELREPPPRVPARGRGGEHRPGVPQRGAQGLPTAGGHLPPRSDLTAGTCPVQGGGWFCSPLPTHSARPQLCTHAKRKEQSPARQPLRGDSLGAKATQRQRLQDRGRCSQGPAGVESSPPTLGHAEDAVTMHTKHR